MVEKWGERGKSHSWGTSRADKQSSRSQAIRPFHRFTANSSAGGSPITLHGRATVSRCHSTRGGQQPGRRSSCTKGHPIRHQVLRMCLVIRLPRSKSSQTTRIPRLVRKLHNADGRTSLRGCRAVFLQLRHKHALPSEHGVACLGRLSLKRPAARSPI